MRAERPLHTLLGFACLTATLLLMSPGVHAVRADSGDLAGVLELVSELPAGPVCSPESAPVPAAPGLAELAEVERGLTALQPGRQALQVGGITMLNMRGYNYGRPQAAPTPELAAVEQLRR